MSSFDKALFARDGWTGLSLSQRFTSNVHKFYGTFKVAIEMLLTNTILGSIPRQLGHGLFYIYIIAVLILVFVVAKDLLWNQHQKKRYEDLDIVGVITSEENYLFKGIFTALTLVFIYFIVYYACQFLLQMIMLQPDHPSNLRKTQW